MRERKTNNVQLSDLLSDPPKQSFEKPTLLSITKKYTTRMTQKQTHKQREIKAEIRTRKQTDRYKNRKTYRQADE